MNETVTQAEVEDVLSSIRRLVGQTKAVSAPAKQTGTKRLVLTPQQRIGQDDVLMLKPEDSVHPAADWQEYEEPPLVLSQRVEDKETGPNSPEVREEPPTTRRKASDVSALTAKIAALEMAIARTTDQWEPDGNSRDPYAGTQPPAMTWRENVELDATGTPLSVQSGHSAPQPQPVTPDQTPAEEAVQAAIDEQVIDEETLREMVAEIVRAELQGALGERITRNVRKLVRREIHRALAAQDLG